MKVGDEKQLESVGDGLWAYLQPDGGWGWSNAGLIEGGDTSMLVDTLFDEPLTARMLERMRSATSAAARIETVVNTHANGDILFHEVHPIVWAGPVERWVAALDRILDMDVEVVVPGHGPLADKRGVRGLRDYLVYLHAEVRKRFEAGLQRPPTSPLSSKRWPPSPPNAATTPPASQASSSRCES